MPTKLHSYQSSVKEYPSVFIPITVSQIAEGLSKLSKNELETIELILNKKALSVITKSRKEANRGLGRFSELITEKKTPRLSIVQNVI